MVNTYEEKQAEQEAVKVAREQADVVVRGRRHAVQDRRDGVQDEHRCRVRDEEPDYCSYSISATILSESNTCTLRLTRGPVPARGGHVVVLQPSGLDAVDEHTPHAELSDNLVQGGLAHEELLRCVRWVDDIRKGTQAIADERSLTEAI